MNGIVFFDPQCSNNKSKISGTIKLHQCNKIAPTVIRIDLKGFKKKSNTCYSYSRIWKYN